MRAPVVEPEDAQTADASAAEDALPERPVVGWSHRHLLDLDVDFDAGIVHYEDREIWVRNYPLPIDADARLSPTGERFVVAAIDGSRLASYAIDRSTASLSLRGPVGPSISQSEPLGNDSSGSVSLNIS